MFASDRDLLILEPMLFRDISWSAQRLVDVANASIDATGLILSAPGAGFDVRAIGAGYVALINETPCEIIDRIDGSTLLISQLRARASDPPIPRAPGASLPLRITTFRPQIAFVHEQILRGVGIEPGEPAPESNAVSESAITNPNALVQLEALGALHIILSSASLLAPDASPLAFKARMYQDRFIAQRARTRIELDLSGDGIHDATRSLVTHTLSRG